MNDTQSVEGQPWFYVRNCGGVGCDETREPSGGDNGAVANLSANARDHGVNLTGKAVEHT
jgi:hypothetical protein